MSKSTVSASEVRFVREGLLKNLRTDGRGRLDFRYLSLETGVLIQANGSARVLSSDTDVLAAVKVEVTEPSLTQPEEGQVEASVYWNVPERRREDRDTELSAMLNR
jgi:exosome complex component RRP42